MPSKAVTATKKLRALTPREQLFVKEYMVDLSLTNAAKRAGYTPKSARGTGHELMQRPHVAAAIEAAMAERSKRTEIKADDVLRRLWAVATADARELVEYRRGCCRYCWGAGNRYQRTAGEMERDREAHERARADAAGKRGKAPGPFDEKGGTGFNAKALPNPKCSECFGDGVGEMHVHDTRLLGEAAARLYAGVKQTRDGLEVKTHSTIEALVHVGQHIGMFKKRLEHTGAEGAPLIPRKKTDLTDDELLAIAAADAKRGRG